MVNSLGVWIYGQPEANKARYSSQHGMTYFSMQYPQAWQQMAKADFSAFQTKEGSWTVDTLNLMRVIRLEKSGLVSEVDQNVDAEYIWKFIDLYTRDLYEDDIRNIKQSVLGYTILVVLLLVIVIVYIEKERRDRVSAGLEAERERENKMRLEQTYGNKLKQVNQNLRRSYEETVKIRDELAEARQYFLNIYESLEDAVVVIDKQGIIMTVNRATIELFGYSETELLGNNVNMLMSGADKVNHDSYLAHYLQTGDAKIIGIGRDVEARRKNGSQMPVNLRVSETKHQGKRAFTGVLRDISEHKRLQEVEHKHLRELEELNLNLQRSNDDLSRFAYAASHDLRAPLRGIKATASWLEEDNQDTLDDDSLENLRLLRSRVDRLDRLLEGLLTYSRITTRSLEPAEVDVSWLIDDIILLLSPPGGLKIIKATSMPLIYTVSVHLQQVLQNLVDNAIKHHDDIPNAIIEISANKKGGMVEFSVKDNGPGIPDYMHDKIFEIFQTMKRRDEVDSIGIGLALVKKLVERYGGDLEVISKEGVRGTEFRFKWQSGGQYD